MKTDRILKIFSIILEASFIGSIILYIYNYYIASKKYEVIPALVKSRLNIFIIVAIITFILFLIIKFVMYLRTKPYDYESEQLQMDLKDEITEDKYKNLEAPVTERVFIYKDEYEIPKNKQMLCPNCKSVIDKNAFICVKCGFLLKKLVQEKVVERVIERPIEKVVEKIIEKPAKTKVVERIAESKPEKVIVKRPLNKVLLTNILINIGLVIAIIIVLLMIINLATERGIIR